MSNNLKEDLRLFWSISFVIGVVWFFIWLWHDPRTPAEKAAAMASYEQRLIEQIEKECGPISAKTIVMDGADDCVKAVMEEDNPDRN
jgi:hypothetical protein